MLHVHISALLSIGIWVGNLLNCKCIYCIMIFGLLTWDMETLQMLCRFLHVKLIMIYHLCKENVKWKAVRCAIVPVCTCIPLTKCYRKMSMSWIFRFLWILLQLLSPSACTSVGNGNLCWWKALWGSWLQADGLEGGAAGSVKYCHVFCGFCIDYNMGFHIVTVVVVQMIVILEGPF